MSLDKLKSMLLGFFDKEFMAELLATFMLVVSNRFMFIAVVRNRFMFIAEKITR